jgi:penicillin-insensitive murein DD-endopeptidase
VGGPAVASSHMQRIASFLIVFAFLAGCGPQHPADEMIGNPLPIGTVVRTPIDGDPTEGPNEQAVGFYSSGHLKNASNVGVTGPGYMKLFLHRDTGWTTFDMTAVIQMGSLKVQKAFPNREPVQLGDLSLEHGGTIGGHASHQNGLDGDIKFMALDGHIQNPDRGDTGFDEEFVVNGRLSKNFDLARNWTLIKAFVGTGRVNRIFVDEVIKASLCQYTKSVGEFSGNIEVLRRLRPYPDHKDHMHVRITCPAKSPLCENQDDPPAGSGC